MGEPLRAAARDSLKHTRPENGERKRGVFAGNDTGKGRAVGAAFSRAGVQCAGGREFGEGIFRTP